MKTFAQWVHCLVGLASNIYYPLQLRTGNTQTMLCIYLLQLTQTLILAGHDSFDRIDRDWKYGHFQMLMNTPHHLLLWLFLSPWNICVS